MYKGHAGSCNYTRLTKEDVVVRDIAEVRNTKNYKIQAMAATAKQAVTLGTTIMAYADFVKTSFPKSSATTSKNEPQTVNNNDDTGDIDEVDNTLRVNHVGKVLTAVFGLSPEQQQYFWDTSRLNEWAARRGITLSPSDIRSALVSASATVS
jgi:hypothetical protein